MSGGQGREGSPGVWLWGLFPLRTPGAPASLGCSCPPKPKEQELAAAPPEACFIFCEEVMRDLEAMRLLALPAGSPKKSNGGFCPCSLGGHYTSYRPERHCAPASEVRFTLPLASSFRERSQLWALQRVKLARSFSHHSPWSRWSLSLWRGHGMGVFLSQRDPQLYLHEGGVALSLRVRGGPRDM